MIFKSICGNFNSFEELSSELEKLPRRNATLLIGIDGCGGSGKSTFAKELIKVNSAITIVHMDDFYLPSNKRLDCIAIEKPIGSDFDWERVVEQLLKPLAFNNEAKYQKYDWIADKLSKWNTIPYGGIVVVEGIYSIRKELAKFYDFKIFVECRREIRLSRGIERDGEGARDVWENNWMVSEDKYIKAHKPFERADLVIDGSSNK